METQAELALARSGWSSGIGRSEPRGCQAVRAGDEIVCVPPEPGTALRPPSVGPAGPNPLLVPLTLNEHFGWESDRTQLGRGQLPGQVLSLRLPRGVAPGCPPLPLLPPPPPSPSSPSPSWPTGAEGGGARPARGRGRRLGATCSATGTYEWPGRPQDSATQGHHAWKLSPGRPEEAFLWPRTMRVTTNPPAQPLPPIVSLTVQASAQGRGGAVGAGSQAGPCL